MFINFFLVFAVGYIATSVITISIYLNSDSVISLGLVMLISVFAGLLLACFSLPPILLNYCFVADLLHMAYIKNLKSELTNLMSSSKIGENEDSKELLEALLRSLETPNAPSDEEDDSEVNE